MQAQQAPEPKLSSVQMAEKFIDESKKFGNVEVAAHEHLEFEGEFIRAEVAFKHDKDLIFQFFMKKFPKDFDKLLAEIVEAHFGTTDNFAVHYEAILESWGLIARGFLARPGVDHNYIIEGFLNLVDNTLGELRSEKK